MEETIPPPFVSHFKPWMEWSGECFSDFQSELPCNGVHRFTSQWS